MTNKEVFTLCFTFYGVNWKDTVKCRYTLMLFTKLQANAQTGLTAVCNCLRSKTNSRRLEELNRAAAFRETPAVLVRESPGAPAHNHMLHKLWLKRRDQPSAKHNRLNGWVAFSSAFNSCQIKEKEKKMGKRDRKDQSEPLKLFTTLCKYMPPFALMTDRMFYFQTSLWWRNDVKKKK